MPRAHSPSPAANAPVAFVTGAARGIGLAVAEKFLAQGYRVALIDNDRKTLAATGKRLADKRRVLAVFCDVRYPRQVAAAVARTLRTFGRIDALVNNAGIAVFKPVLQTSLQEWNDVIANNLTGAFICAQACAPALIESGAGAIVNIASISGLRASTLRVAYGTSKAGIIHLTKQFAAELGAEGVRVNCVAPGPVDTDMAKLVHTVAIRQDYYDAIPLGRYGTTEEIADAVFYLCSPAAGYVNGQVIAADGGFESTGVGLPTLRKNRNPKRTTQGDRK